MTQTAGCGRFGAESAPGVPRETDSVAPEGGGQVIPTLGGGYAVDSSATDLPTEGPHR